MTDWDPPFVKQRLCLPKQSGVQYWGTFRMTPAKRPASAWNREIYFSSWDKIKFHYCFSFWEKRTYFSLILAYSASLMHSIHCSLSETAPSWYRWRFSLVFLLSGDFLSGIFCSSSSSSYLPNDGSQGYFSVCILPESSSISKLLLPPRDGDWHFLAHSSSPGSSPMSPSSCPWDISTATSPWLLPPIWQVQEINFRPSMHKSPGSLRLNEPLNHPDIPHAPLTDLLPSPQIQTPNCAWIYIKMSLMLIFPSLFDLPPLLPAPLTSQPLISTPPHPSLPTSLYPVHPSQPSSNIMAASPSLEYPLCLSMFYYIQSWPDSMSFLIFIIWLQEVNFISP